MVQTSSASDTSVSSPDSDRTRKNQTAVSGKSSGNAGATNARSYPFGGWYVAALFVALIKDTLDFAILLILAIPLVGIVGILLNWTLSLSLGFFVWLLLFLAGSSVSSSRALQRYRQKTKTSFTRHLTVFFGISAEAALPFVNLLPITTIVVVFVYRHDRKRALSGRTSTLSA